MKDEYLCPLAGDCSSYSCGDLRGQVIAKKHNRVRRVDGKYICDGLVDARTKEDKDKDLPECLLVGILNSINRLY